MSVSTSPPVEAASEPPAEPPAHEEKAFKKLFARGSAWALINYAVGYTLRLASNFILWRLLTPDAFGLMAIVNVFIQGLQMFSDIGVGQSVVQNEREDRPFLDTIWTLQVSRGLIVWLLATAAAVPVAHFYHQPALSALIPVVSAGVGIAAFNSVNLFTASRHLAIGRLTAVDISSQAGSLIVMVVWSYLTHSVWGLAVGSVVSALVRLVLSFKMLPGPRNRFCWDRDTVRAVAHFGRWIFLSTILTFLASYSDRLIFGKLVSIERLGVYSIALVWATFPFYVISHVAGSVLFPLFSRMNKTEGGSVPKSFAQVRRPVLFAAGWLYACLLAGGPTLIRFLYDQRAAEAGLIVQLLAIGSWFASIESTNSYSLLALGRPKWLAFGNASKLIGMVVLLPIGAHFFGFAATVLALSLSEICRYAVSATACTRAGLRPVRQDLILSVGIAVTGAIGLLVRAGYGRLHLAISNHHVDAFLEGTAIFLVLSAIWWALFKRAQARAAAAA
ncbi:MAG TPA: oligosaccharide flippase family protein [Polyangia bacterium]|nr:oligosaccharide flippase family protein [Polyangia bacterium]HVZ87403.1 oligosaccharide flippase family protein [Polyangia bacterium]